MLLQNPLRAGIVEDPEKYRWSSYRDYIKKEHTSLTDTQFILELFSPDIDEAIKGFMTFHNAPERNEFSVTDGKKISDGELRQEILAALDGKEICTLNGLPKRERDSILSALRRQGYSIRQIERATGISRGVIFNSAANTTK